MFEDMIQMRDSESRYLFPLPDVSESDELPVVPDSLSTDEFPPLESTPAEMGIPQRRQRSQSTASADTRTDADAGTTAPIFQFLAVELCLFMILFFVLSVLTQAIAPGIQAPNWKLAVTALCFHVFLESSMLWFGGRMLGSLLSRTGRKD